MIISQNEFLFILVVLALLSLSLQKEEKEECYKVSTIHFKDDHCSLTPSSYEQLKTTLKLCANIAYLGYHDNIEKHMFLTNDFNLIGFEDESNVWTKAMVNNDIDKYNFTFIKSQLLEKHLYLLVLHNDSYYIIISEILKGDKKINASMVKLGQRDIVFPNLECDNIYFIKVEGGNTVYLYKGLNFEQEKLKSYDRVKYLLRLEYTVFLFELQSIKILKPIKPSKFEVLTTDNRIEVLLCDQCLFKKKKTMNHQNENGQTKEAVIQIISENIGIVIVLSLFCASLLIVIIVVGIIYYRRYEKNKAKRNEIKIAEKEVLLKDHFQERTTAQTPNLSNISQSDKGIPNKNDTLGGSNL